MAPRAAPTTAGLWRPSEDPGVPGSPRWRRRPQHRLLKQAEPKAGPEAEGEEDESKAARARRKVLSRAGRCDVQDHGARVGPAGGRRE